MSGPATNEPLVHTIISGGQTGVDRAALDFALDHGFECGGWIPRGRRTEDGCLPQRYPLKELPTRDYRDRTLRNVQDSDGTLILTRGVPRGGTAYTLACAKQQKRPFMSIDLDEDPDVQEVRSWLSRHGITTLNVAGPRLSQHHDIYILTKQYLSVIFHAGNAA